MHQQASQQRWERRIRSETPFTCSRSTTRAYLAVLLPLSAIALILPNRTLSTALEGTLNFWQAMLFSAATIVLYAIFLALQTMRHRGFFQALPSAKDERAGAEQDPSMAIGHRQSVTTRARSAAPAPTCCTGRCIYCCFSPTSCLSSTRDAWLEKCDTGAEGNIYPPALACVRR